MDEIDNYTRGYMEADEAIRLKLPGYRDRSQGDSEWDRGWNARLDRGDTRACTGVGESMAYIMKMMEK